MVARTGAPLLEVPTRAQHRGRPDPMTMINSSSPKSGSGSASVELSTVFGCATFSELVLATGGRHPTELLGLLRELDESDPAFRRHVQGLIDDAMVSVAG